MSVLASVRWMLLENETLHCFVLMRQLSLMHSPSFSPDTCIMGLGRLNLVAMVVMTVCIGVRIVLGGVFLSSLWMAACITLNGTPMNSMYVMTIMVGLMHFVSFDYVALFSVSVILNVVNTLMSRFSLVSYRVVLVCIRLDWCLHFCTHYYIVNVVIVATVLQVTFEFVLILSLFRNSVTIDDISVQFSAFSSVSFRITTIRGVSVLCLNGQPAAGFVVMTPDVCSDS